MNEEIKVGDVLENVSPHALARRVRVIRVLENSFTAEVLVGADTSQPLTVYRAGWHLYQKSKHKMN